MLDSLAAIQVESHQCPSHQSILLTQGPILEIFIKNIENWPSWKMTLFCVSYFEFFISKKKCFKSMKTSSPFIRGIIYFCTMDGFRRILEKTSSEFWTNMHRTVATTIHLYQHPQGIDKTKGCTNIFTNYEIICASESQIIK